MVGERVFVQGLRPLEFLLTELTGQPSAQHTKHDIER